MGKQGISQEAEVARLKLDSTVRKEVDLALLPQRLGVSLDSHGTLILPPEIKKRLESLSPEQRQGVNELLQKIVLEQEEAKRPKDLLERFLGVLHNSAKGLSHTLEATFRITFGVIYQYSSSIIGLLKGEDPLEVFINSGHDYEKVSKYLFNNFSFGSVYPQEKVLAKMGRWERVMLSNPLAHLSSALFDPLYDGIDYLKNESRRGIMNARGANLSEQQFLELAKTDPLLRISSFAFNIAQGSLMLASILCGNFQGVARLAKLLFSGGTFSLVSSVGNQLLHREEMNYLALAEETVDQWAKSLTFSGGLRWLGAKHATKGAKIDFVDAQGDLSAASVQLSKEIEKLESWEELKEEKVQRRLAGAITLLGTSGYDAVDGKISGILDFKADQDSNSENKVFDQGAILAVDAQNIIVPDSQVLDHEKLLALDPQELDKFQDFLHKLLEEFLDPKIPVIDRNDKKNQIKSSVWILCLLQEKTKEVNPKLDQLCIQVAENLLFNCLFEDLLKLNSICKFTAELKSQIYQAYCYKKVESYSNLPFFNLIRAEILTAGIIFENKRLFDDLREVEKSFGSNLDEKKYYIFGKLSGEAEYVITNYTLHIEGVTWPTINHFIAETFEIFEIDNPEERTRIFNKAKTDYFRQRYVDQISSLASIMLLDLKEGREFGDFKKNEFIKRVIECFDLVSLEITEKQLAEGSVLSNSLKYKKTISGHFIDLSAITLFMEAFSKVSNIPATAVVFSEILSTITEKQKDIIVNGLARILICCEESVSYTKNIINLFGLANSDILSSAVEEAILCCYNPKRDQSLPLRFVQPLRVEEARMLDIGFYRARVKEIDNRIASRNFSLSRQAKLEAHQSALLHLTEIAKMQVSRYLQSAVRERIGFACDLIRKCSGSEKQDYIEQTKRVFTESEWRDRNSFFSFYENLVETAYVSLTNSDYDSTISNEFQELFADIHLLEPEVIKQIFPDIMDAVFEVALSFQENLKLAISNLVFFANSPNNRSIQNFLLEKIELSLKEMLITNILEGLDVDNNYLDLHDKILEACSDDFTPEQKRALLKKALEQIADYVSIDPNEPGYATKDKLKKLISKIGTIRSRYYLDPEFVQEIISKINSLLN